jgi:hypothetical protein
MSFISGMAIGSFLGVTSQLDEAKRRRHAAVLFLQKRIREERDCAKRAGGATWARYLQKKSQRKRRDNLSTRLTPIERDKRLKRFRRTVARRDVSHLCLRCKNVLQNWRPNKKFCGKKCSSDWWRSFNQWKKRQIEIGVMKIIYSARSKGEDITQLVERHGGSKKIDRLCDKYAKREEADDFQN